MGEHDSPPRSTHVMGGTRLSDNFCRGHERLSSDWDYTENVSSNRVQGVRGFGPTIRHIETPRSGLAWGDGGRSNPLPDWTP